MLLPRFAANSALRASLFIATKVAGPRAGGDGAKCPEARERTLAGESDGTEPKCDFSDAQIRRACDASLKRLQTNYIDLYGPRNSGAILCAILCAILSLRTSADAPAPFRAADLLVPPRREV